ncbi:MAG: hypothetical protein ACD_28C00409G0013 [uncultured bacterium]|nr:MAG: hypothetical protein ACD_28C00409G0013 [uncultured bacterium]KKT76558.1 MAG: Fructose-1,6-bisphosphate aldolase [Candidatus Peregrinibacteria bacterium GW2011_GWA2_44_7]
MTHSLTNNLMKTQAELSAHPHNSIPMLAELNASNNPYLKVLPSGFHMVNLKTLLTVADQHRFGIVAINQRSPQIVRATLEAAWRLKSPVILEIAESEIEYCSMDTDRLAAVSHEIVQEMIEKYGYAVPVGLHHDHIQKDVVGCTDRSIKAGFSSILIDLSKLSLDENIAKCQEVIRKIYPLGIALEAEEGFVHSVEATDVDHIYQDVENYYTKVEDILKLIVSTGATGASCFIGNQHGIYKAQPRIGYDRLREISEAIREYQSYPVMHGGSGLAPDQFRKIIEAGARKINYATSVSNIWFEHFPQPLLDKMNEKAEATNRPLRKVLKWFEEDIEQLDHTASIEAMVEHIMHMMTHAFGSHQTALHYRETVPFLQL